VNPHPASADRWLLHTKGTNWYKTIEEYRQYLDEAIGIGGWLILNNHIVLPECGVTAFCVECSMLDGILDYAEGNGVGLATIDEILSGAWTRDPTRFEPDVARAGPGELVVLRSESGGGQVRLRGEAGDWTVTVHDVGGRRVARLHDGPLPPGEHTFRWDGRDGTGSAAGSGVYFVRAVGRPGGAIATKALILR